MKPSDPRSSPPLPDEDDPARRTSRDGRWAILTWGLLVVLALVPVALLSLYSFTVMSGSVRDLARRNNMATATVTRQLVVRELERTSQLAVSVAALPGTIDAVQRHDENGVRSRLRPVVVSFPGIDRAYVLDRDGTEWSDYPRAPESLGKNFSKRDYFVGLSRNWRPYVSEVFRRNASPQAMVVAAAAPILTEHGEVIGALVCEYRLEDIASWLRQINIGDGGYVVLIDPSGTVAAHPKLNLQDHFYDDYMKVDLVRQAIGGKAGSGRYTDPLSGEQMIATFLPINIGGRYWVVVAQQPEAMADAPITQLRTQISLGSVILALLAMAAAIVLGRSSAGNRRLRMELAYQNQRLQQLAAIVSSSDDAILSHSPAGIIRHWNPGAQRLYGYTAEEAVGKPVRMLFAEGPRVSSASSPGETATFRPAGQYETRHVRKDGGIVDVFVTVSPVRDENGAVVASAMIARDITEHKQMEDLLDRERNLLRSLIDNLPDNIYVKDLEGRYILDNVAHARFVGIPADEILGKTVFDLFPREMAERFAADDEAVIRSREPMLNREEPIRGVGGDMGWVSTTKVPLMDGQGNVVGLVCVSRDVTARRRAEQEMRELQRFLASIIENIPDMIFVKDARDLRFVEFNRAAEELIGQSRDQVVGKNDHDLFPPDEADFFNANDRAVLEGRQLIEVPAEHIQTPRGLRILHTKKIPLLDDDGNPRYLLGISEDVTDRVRAQEELVRKNQLLEEAVSSERRAHEELKQAQTQLVQTEKLASLGQLVAGVAHEINNPLAFVSNNVAVLQRDVRAVVELLKLYRGEDAAVQRANPELSKQIAELAERIDLNYTVSNLPDLLARSREGLKRIQEIVRDLRDFARQETVGDYQEGVDLNAGILSTLNIVRGRARKTKVELEADLTPLPGITCEPARINQVVLNLMVNAVDACENGGDVKVRTRVAGDGVEIEIADTGTGIAPEIRDKIFDPFFTTKPQGQGTGLGLSISYGIVRDHGGNISVDSTPGKGSRFVVHLPMKPPRFVRPTAEAARV